MILGILYDSWDTIWYYIIPRIPYDFKILRLVWYTWFLGYYMISMMLYDIIWYYMILYDFQDAIWYYMILYDFQDAI